MEFLIYIEVGLALFTVAMVLWVIRLAKRDKAAAVKKSLGDNREH
jgi:hypothetical protein